MTEYRFILTDLLTGVIKDEVPLRSVRFGNKLNAPGTMTASIDYRHPKATSLNFSRCRTAVYVMRGNQCVWGGILWTLRRNGDGLNIGCEGFWSYFRRRRLRHDRDWSVTGQDTLAIVRNLINYAQDTSINPSGDIGVTVGSELSGISVLRGWFGYERRIIADIIEALTDNTASFDFEILPRYDENANTFTKTLKLYNGKMGRRTQIAWEIGTHCELEEYYMDGTRQENVVHGIGAGEAQTMLLTTAADSNQLKNYPLLEGAFIAKDISKREHLQEMCENRLARRRLPEATPDIRLRQGSPDTVLGTFIVGDEVQLLGGDGFCTFNQYFRIDSYTVNLSEEGNEDIKVEFQNRSLAEDEEMATG